MNPIVNFLGNWFMTSFNDTTILVTLGIIIGFGITSSAIEIYKGYKEGK